MQNCAQRRVQNSLFARMAQALRRLLRKEEQPYDPYQAKQLNRDVEEALRR